MRLKECFYADAHKYNEVPRFFLKQLFYLFLFQRYSMPVLMRLTEYFYRMYLRSGFRIFYLCSSLFKRMNELLNQFEHGYEHDIAYGTLFHHTGVTISGGTCIGRNVQIFKGVTLARKSGKDCDIGDDSVIFSHVIILGKKVGRNCAIGAGSVVVSDVPDNSVVAGVPARIIGECEKASEYLEYR